jgi:cyclopropane fatty-acyl-phospholipid synthase-like methyltransferase
VDDGPTLTVADVNYNLDDQKRWDQLFASVPPEWKDAPATGAMKACLKFLLANRASNVLDVGCGVGRWAVYLAKAGLRVTAFDFSQNAIDFATTWAGGEGLDIQFTCQAITAPTFPGGRFDGAVAALVFDNVAREEMYVAITLIRSSLIEGGGLFALFNPLMTEEEKRKEADSDNPTAGITNVSYTDDELLESFPGFQIVAFKKFERGTRGLCLVKRTA